MAIHNQEPQIRSFTELGITTDKTQLSTIAHWIAANAVPVELVHDNPTCRDGRVSSSIRKTPGVLFNSATAVPELVHGIVHDLYTASSATSSHYLQRPVGFWNDKYAAMGHLYLPGDEPTEGHVDQMASATAYFEQPSDGRKLYISRDASAQTIEEILQSDPYVITPEPETVVFFDGQNLPHFVGGVSVLSDGRGTSINFSMDDGSDPAGLTDYGYANG